MTKQKSSFFERLTGAKNIENNGYADSVPVYNEEKEESIPMREPSPAFTTHNEEAWGASVSNQRFESDGAEGQLTIDVYQTENDIVIKSTIAGVKPEDLDVSINNDMVTVKGERKNEEIVKTEITTTKNVIGDPSLDPSSCRLMSSLKKLTRH